MKFVLMIYQPFPFDPKSLPAEEHAAIAAEYGAVSSTPQVTPGPPLGLPDDAKTVTVQDGKIVTTNGPYVGVAGAVGGFMIFDAASLDEAVELAGRVPAARLGGAVEIRPCAVYW
ncbi:YciI family protein [uncultured Devosia sp.]|uniref:YciI family protein n=1 Tax=uncultured Devosia sp. TaxID=211434 RepID=UPI0035CC3099